MSIADAGRNQEEQPGEGEEQNAEMGNPALDPPFTLIVHDDALIRDTFGRLTPNPDLLGIVKKGVRALAAEKRGPTLLSKLACLVGSYQQDLIWEDGPQGSILGDDEGVGRLIKTLAADCARLRQNARLSKPKTASQLHIPEDRLRLLEALARIGALGSRADLRRNSNGVANEVPLPDQAHLDALPKPPQRPQAVAGMVTGVGLAGEGSCRIEVNKGASLLVKGLSLDAAFRYLTDPTHVTGTRIEIEGVLHLDSPVFDTARQEVLCL